MSGAITITWFPVKGWPGIPVRIDGKSREVLGEEPIHRITSKMSSVRAFCGYTPVRCGINASVDSEDVTCPVCVEKWRERYGDEQIEEEA